MRVVVARVGRAHGLQGEVTVELRTDSPSSRFSTGARLEAVPPVAGAGPASPPARVLTLTGARAHANTWILRFAEVADRTAAEALRGSLLEAEVPEESDEPDAWYDSQLVGLRAVSPTGEVLGEVVAVEHPPAQDLLVVARPDGERRLVPFVTALVPTVDPARGLVVVDAPPGLLEDLPDDVPPTSRARRGDPDR